MPGIRLVRYDQFIWRHEIWLACGSFFAVISKWILELRSFDFTFLLLSSFMKRRRSTSGVGLIYYFVLLFAVSFVGLGVVYHSSTFLGARLSRRIAYLPDDLANEQTGERHRVCPSNDLMVLRTCLFNV